MARLEALTQAGREAHLHKPRAVVHRHALGSMTRGQRTTKAGLQPRTLGHSVGCWVPHCSRCHGHSQRRASTKWPQVHGKGLTGFVAMAAVPRHRSARPMAHTRWVMRVTSACSTEKSGPSANSMEHCLWTPGSFSYTTRHKSGHAKQKYGNSHVRLNAAPFNRISQVEFRSGVVNQTKL